jgi:hypothetical protein
MYGRRDVKIMKQIRNVYPEFLSLSHKPQSTERA